MRVLVTGGAGYIGSHAVLQLGEAGHDVVVCDNLSTGHQWAVLRGELVEGDLVNEDKLNRVFREQAFNVVIHAAANVVVPESIENPFPYIGFVGNGTLANPDP